MLLAGRLIAARRGAAAGRLTTGRLQACPLPPAPVRIPLPVATPAPRLYGAPRPPAALSAAALSSTAISATTVSLAPIAATTTTPGASLAAALGATPA